MEKNPPANAGDTGSIPGLGRVHVPVSPWATTTELAYLEPVLGNERSHLTTKSSYSQRKPACSKEDPA